MPGLLIIRRDRAPGMKAPMLMTAGTMSHAQVLVHRIPSESAEEKAVTSTKRNLAWAPIGVLESIAASMPKVNAKNRAQ